MTRSAQNVILSDCTMERTGWMYPSAGIWGLYSLQPAEKIAESFIIGDYKAAELGGPRFRA